MLNFVSVGKLKDVSIGEFVYNIYIYKHVETDVYLNFS